MKREANQLSPGKNSEWEALVSLEPKLGDLYAAVTALTDGEKSPTECSGPGWYNYAKPYLQKLVGWSRPEFHPILSSSQAYDVAYQTLLQAVPPCAEE